MKTSEKTTFRILLDQVKDAKSRADLRELELKVIRHYVNGSIPETQLAFLEMKIMEKLATL